VIGDAGRSVKNGSPGEWDTTDWTEDQALR